MSVIITTAADHHLEGILALQRQNHRDNLTTEVMEEQGFVTVVHEYEILKAMNDVHAHAIALDGDRVIGYAIAMHKQFANDIPLLTSLFERIDRHLLSIDSEDPLNYVANGQVCVGEGYRSKGIFADMYHNIRDRLSDKYDSIFTDIDCANTRSIRAHHKVGFETIDTFEVKGEKWHIVEWKW